jgi:hypothetical protein
MTKAIVSKRILSQLKLSYDKDSGKYSPNRGDICQIAVLFVQIGVLGECFSK